MGSVLLCAGAQGKRSALKHSRVMIHQPLGGARGQASDILIAAQEIEKTRKELYTIIYDLDGRRVDRIITSGIYIINGKKVMIRKPNDRY